MWTQGSVTPKAHTCPSLHVLPHALHQPWELGKGVSGLTEEGRKGRQDLGSKKAEKGPCEQKHIGEERQSL